MTAIPARRKRRLVAAVVSSILSMICLPTGLVVGVNALLNESGGNNVDEIAAVEIPTTPVEMLAVMNSRNEVASIALLSLAPGGKGGTIISVPVGAAADVAKDEAPRRIADSFATGGVYGLKADVENLLNVTIDAADDVTALEFTDLLVSVGDQAVNLAKPVFDSAVNGATKTVVDAGSMTLSPAQIAAALASSQNGIPEAERLPQVKELWSAISRAGQGASAAATGVTTTVPAVTDPPIDTRGYLAGLMSGRVDVWQFSAQLITDAQRNPNNQDLYVLNGGEVLMVMASVAPSTLTLAADAITVMVDVPFSNTNIALEAVTRLAYLGANVAMVRQIDEVPLAQTNVSYAEEIARAEAESYSSLLGPLQFTLGTQTVAGVNIRIVLGNDFVAFLGSGGATTSTVPS